MAEEEEKKPEGGGEPRTPTERTDSPQSPGEPGGRSEKPTPKPEPGQKPEAPKGGKTSKDVPGTKGVPGAGEGKIPGAEGAKAPGGVPAPPAGIPKIPKGLEKDEEGKPRSPMGETPLEGAGKAAGGAKKGLEAGRKALETVPHPAAKAAAKAARVGEWAAGKAEEGMKKKGREISDAAKKEEAGEEEEDLEAEAKAAAAKGKKRLKWLKWPAIFGCLGCGGCTSMLVLILLPIIIVVVILGGGGGGEGEPQGTDGLEGAPAGALPVPFASQKASSCPSSYCGPTCGGMVWGYYSQNQNAQQLVEEIAKEANLGCRPSSEGYSISEWIGVLTSKGINYSESNGVTIRDLQERYYQGHPTMALVTLNSGIKHFVLIVGFSGDSIIYHDPLASSGFSQQSATEFQSRWTGWAGFWSGNAPYKPQRSTDQSYLPIILPPLAQPI